MKEEKFWFVVQRRKGVEDVCTAYVSPLAISEEMLQERIRFAPDNYDYEYIEVPASIWQGLKFCKTIGKCL